MRQLKNGFTKLLDFILYGNFFIALCATMSVLSTVILLSGFADEKDVQLAAFVGAATFFLYNLHKPITYFLRKEVVDNQRFKRAKSFQGPLSILTILAGFYAIYFFFYLTLNSQLLLLLMAFLSLGYVLPMLGHGRRLRDVAYLKIFLIALVWAGVTIGLPYFEVQNSTSSAAFSQLLIERFCFIFALCIPFDIRDTAWDSRTNVKTIPLSIGVKNAKIVGILALFTCILIVLLLKNNGTYSSSQFLKLIVAYLIASFILIKTNQSRHDYFFYGVVDGLILIQSLVIIFG